MKNDLFRGFYKLGIVYKKCLPMPFSVQDNYN